MRSEFQIRVAGITDVSDSILISFPYEDIGNASDLILETEEPEPAWLDFFFNPNLSLDPYPTRISQDGKYSKAQTLAALEGLRSYLDLHGKRLEASPRWKVRAFDAEYLQHWLVQAGDAVNTTPPETRFNPVRRDD